jgi:hypothetical protein
MIYSVVPRQLEETLLPQLVSRYAGDPEVAVIVDRRKGERRSREAAPDDIRQQRVLRDRRRRRVSGEFAPLREDAPPTSGA